MKEKQGKSKEKMRVLDKELGEKFDNDLTLSWLEKSVESHDSRAAWFYS